MGLSIKAAVQQKGGKVKKVLQIGKFFGSNFSILDYHTKKFTALPWLILNTLMQNFGTSIAINLKMPDR
jgi:hypothetical protein